LPIALIFLVCAIAATDETFDADLVDSVEGEILIMQVSEYMHNENLLVS
jgi:hypothetical protein